MRTRADGAPITWSGRRSRMNPVRGRLFSRPPGVLLNGASGRTRAASEGREIVERQDSAPSRISASHAGRGVCVSRHLRSSTSSTSTAIASRWAGE